MCHAWRLMPQDSRLKSHCPLQRKLCTQALGTGRPNAHVFLAMSLESWATSLEPRAFRHESWPLSYEPCTNNSYQSINLFTWYHSTQLNSTQLNWKYSAPQCSPLAAKEKIQLCIRPPRGNLWVRGCLYPAGWRCPPVETERQLENNKYKNIYIYIYIEL